MATKWEYCRIEVLKTYAGVCFFVAPPRESDAELLAALGLKPLKELIKGIPCAEIPQESGKGDDCYYAFWWRAVEAMLERGWEPFQIDTRHESSTSLSMHFKRHVERNT